MSIQNSTLLIGVSAAIQRISAQIGVVANSGATVLILGETGVGKGVAARLIHGFSARRDHPFVSLNCGALPDSLVESLLFGHTRGAFTGATADTSGQFEAAARGSLLLDDIECLPLASQAKLLRVIERGEYLPLGAKKPRQADVRILAASNRDLERLAEAGQFRPDLYYRLHVVPMRLAPLRERRDDIPILAQHFLRAYARETGVPVTGFSDPELKLLQEFSWPGNVRQLKNVIEYAALTAGGPLVDLETNPAFDFLREASALPAGSSSLNLRERLVNVERELLHEALRRSGGVRKQAAEMLGIDQRNLAYFLKKHHRNGHD